MRSREACGVVPRKRKEELDVETRCVGFSLGSSVKATMRSKVDSKFPEKRKKEKQRKDVEQVPSAHYFICFKRSGLKTFIVLVFHSSIYETSFPYLRLVLLITCFHSDTYEISFHSCNNETSLKFGFLSIPVFLAGDY